MSGPRVAVAATGVANLASVLAAFARAGAVATPTADPGALADAELAVLPGVGAFGAAMAALRSRGLDRAFAERWRRGAPSLGICLGMQLFFEGSEESPEAEGLGILGGVARRFRRGLPLPQLGWNYVFARCAKTLALREGWAYFANSYRIEAAPEGAASLSAEYGETFVAALEAGPATDGRPALLLCQFHPELSGRWGGELLARWLRPGEGGRA
jgi:imidazole glycerol phosphate synthase glutamine amidotransferase subunit